MIDYATGGPLTALSHPVAEQLPHAVADLCRLAAGLVIQPADARAQELPASRFDENQLRPASRIVDALLAVDPAELTVARPPARRVVGTCRHFAVLTCALLRHRGVPARARCGFATYFQPGQGLDHWITEVRNAGGRWRRVDSEVLGGDLPVNAEDLAAGDFLTGGEAWVAYREGRIDATTFGVYGTENWGPAEIRGNAVRDLAALNRVEMLPWDEWGRMTASYQGTTGAEYDALMDTVAATCAADDPRELARLYASEDLTVPAGLVR
ncbi:transglutaminase-like domain-containing protein [Cryptosporangium japonicum]|uniref:Transglutaminase-like domain-containing protein n=1 Tax=Cryptosporangium japonicum TaxID=80872 RepID=A0ABN0UDA7_9ACTN